MKLQPQVQDVTHRILQRSQTTRNACLRRIDTAARRKPGTERMGYANVAHALASKLERDKIAALPGNSKLRIEAIRAPNIGIVTAHNDMLSVHAPMQQYPDLIKREARKLAATAQVAGGVSAMCDGVTQGTPGMELSLSSRDVIAMATAVALSHDMVDGALMLGMGDKIVPRLLIGALHFGYLPTVFVPAGPMTSGLSKTEKGKVRELAARGLVDRPEPLHAKSRACHGMGTCTFYGTANSNQMLPEAMGLLVPGSAFVHPGAAWRKELAREALRTVLGRPTAISSRMHADVLTLRPGGLREFTHSPQAMGDALDWTDAGASLDESVLRGAAAPFSATGGLKLLRGNLGRSVIKVSAVPEDRHVVQAPARLFDSQDELHTAFDAGELDRDVIGAVRWQGPRANGMRELHKLTPPMAVLQGRGFKVAPVTDGRMSGASGKVPAAIHESPEAAAGGPLARLRNGDMLRLDAVAGTLQALVPDEEWNVRVPDTMPGAPREANRLSIGPELFAGMRRNAVTAEKGAGSWL